VLMVIYVCPVALRMVGETPGTFSVAVVGLRRTRSVRHRANQSH
jgi:hypothetical protein